MSTQLSKFLSLVLRHDPARIGITLDPAGWTDVGVLQAACAAHGVAFTRDELVALVAASDKQRFALSPDRERIRANQGHTVAVELALSPVAPPPTLYHGTVARFVDAIRAEGLVRGSRHHVHLSASRDTALAVGGRRGRPVVLEVRAAEMAAAGHAFFVSDNGVWLTAHVPPEFIDFPVPSLRPGRPEAVAPRDGGGRACKIEIARATLAACEAGRYAGPSGEPVSLAPAIAAAVAGTVTYDLDHPLPSGAPRPAPTAIEVTNESTLEALVRLAGDTPTGGSGRHLGCLNFASARNPGGGFLGGAQAQEESLARSSALYPCLQTQPDVYARNRAQRSLLHLDLAIWSPGVPFFRDDAGGWLVAPILASVITCAAPNAAALSRGSAAKELAATLARRARLVLAIARHHAIDTLVLGAWGAGVFRNDPVMVARVFRELLAGEHAASFARVVFAVPGTPETSANHRAFADAFATNARIAG